MTIKVIRLKKITGQNSLRAFADVSFGGILTVHGCSIFDGKNGLFCSLPSNKSAKDGKYYAIVRIDDELTKAEFTKTLLEAYNANSPVAAPAQASGDVPF